MVVALFFYFALRSKWTRCVAISARFVGAPPHPREVSSSGNRVFHQQVHGISYQNDDGTSRQKIINHCSEGEEVFFVPEPDNRFDPAAVKVCRKDGEQLGYLPAGGHIASDIGLGWTYRITIDEIYPFEENPKKHGVRLRVEVLTMRRKADDRKKRAAVRPVRDTMPREGRQKPKTEMQLRQEALVAQSTEALRQRYPRVLIDETNIGYTYSTGAWNNGKPHSAALPSLSFSLKEGKAHEVDNSSQLPAVYAHQKDLERIRTKPNGLLFVLFGQDNALAFAQIPMGKEYRTTVYENYALPIEDLKFLTTFVDPTTEMRRERDEKRRAEASERCRKIDETIEAKQLKLGDNVVWTDPITGESIDYGVLYRSDIDDLMVRGAKQNCTTCVGNKRSEIARRCFRRSK